MTPVRLPILATVFGRIALVDRPPCSDQIAPEIPRKGVPLYMVIRALPDPSSQPRKLRKDLPRGGVGVTPSLPPRPRFQRAQKAHNQCIRVKVIAHNIKELSVREPQAPEVPFPPRRPDPLPYVGNAEAV